jgi:hypothetical protein
VPEALLPGQQIGQSQEINMAKGQSRSNREIRKPKKAAAPKSVLAASTVTTTFAKTGKGSGKPVRK